MRASGADEDALVLGDIGSTFTKLVTLDGEGRPLRRLEVPTTRGDIADGVGSGLRALRSPLEDRGLPLQLVLSSSAGGGLRIIVVGYERELTLKAALRTSASAGARIVGVYTGDQWLAETPEGLRERAPDLALLTGGTDGGDRHSIVRSARRLQHLAPGLPVVLAGNELAREEAMDALGNGRPVAVVGNVMPRIGAIEPGEAQEAIRELFIGHVMGHGRYASASPIAASVRVPTPAAVLAGARAVAALGDEHPLLARPVLVDIGGATTDVHSVIAETEPSRGYVDAGLPDQAVTRTVEGDLGLRENAEALVDAAAREGYLDGREAERLGAAVERRRRQRDFVPTSDDEARIDERLAELATAIALHRHAGVLRTSLTPAGAVLRRTGRDLRAATCLVLTGGVFEHTGRPATIAERALRLAHGYGALVPERLPVFRDRSYLLWAAGLVEHVRPESAPTIVKSTLERAEVDDEQG